MHQVKMISWVVFDDINGNGTQDAGELGIENVEVILTDDLGNTIATLSTDSDGNWTSIVPAGDITSTITTATLPNGNEVQTAGDNPTTTLVDPGQMVNEAPDGFFTPNANLALEKEASPIVDENNNGITDAGDTIL